MTGTDVLFVLGTRPEIIKTAPVIKECDDRGLDTWLVHTGQHYSESLDDVFFDELELSPPDVNLGVGSDSHGAQTGAMLGGVEAELQARDPSAVVVQGDTNSTLAGGLAGAKLDVTVAHIEAGLRSYDREMPEETNRVVVDHVADELFPPTPDAAANLRNEGLPADRITVTGNTIVDAVHAYEGIAKGSTEVLEALGIEGGRFALLTAHRAETVDDRERFASVLRGVDHAADQLDLEVIYPIHPRARERLEAFSLTVPSSIQLVDPLGFLPFLRLESEAAVVFTDSGGVQEECCILGTPCVTLRYGTERPETVHVGANCVAGHDPVEIVAAGLTMCGRDGDWSIPFGDGDAAEMILDALGVAPSRTVSEAAE